MPRRLWLAACLAAAIGCGMQRNDELAAQAELARALAAQPKTSRAEPEAQNGASIEVLLAAPGASRRAAAGLTTGLALKGVDVVLTDGATISLLRGGKIEPLVSIQPARTEATPALLAVDGEKSFVVTYPALGEIRRVDASTGAAAVVASGLDWPLSPVILPDGSIVVAETGAGRISRIDPHGTRIALASGLLSPVGMTRSGGRLLVVEFSGGRLLSIREGASPVVIATGLLHPLGVATDRIGRVFVAEAGSHSIVRLDRDGSRLVVVNKLPIAVGDAPRPTDVPLAVDRDDSVVFLTPTSGEVFRLSAP